LTPGAQLAHYPRYLKAIAARLGPAESRSSARQHPDVGARPAANGLCPRAFRPQRSSGLKTGGFRWLLEELRVSLFAQELKTPMPVSVKRLQKVWASIGG